MEPEQPEGCSENTLVLLGFFSAPRKICDFPYVSCVISEQFLQKEGRCEKKKENEGGENKNTHEHNIDN